MKAIIVSVVFVEGTQVKGGEIRKKRSESDEQNMRRRASVVAGSAQLLPRQSEEKQRRAVENKRNKRGDCSHKSVRSESRRRPDGQSDDENENDKRRESDEAALRPLHFSLAHVSDEFSALFSGFGGFPISRCAEGNAENDRSKDPEDREYC